MADSQILHRFSDVGSPCRAQSRAKDDGIPAANQIANLRLHGVMGRAVVSGGGTGAERRIATLDVPPQADVRMMSLHPDGKRFLTALSMTSSNIWIVEGVRPD